MGKSQTASLLIENSQVHFWNGGKWIILTSAIQLKMEQHSTQLCLITFCFKDFCLKPVGYCQIIIFILCLFNLAGCGNKEAWEVGPVSLFDFPHCQGGKSLKIQSLPCAWKAAADCAGAVGKYNFQTWIALSLMQVQERKIILLFFISISGSCLCLFY